jgi:hypothetical protein
MVVVWCGGLVVVWWFGGVLVLLCVGMQVWWYLFIFYLVFMAFGSTFGHPIHKDNRHRCYKQLY